MLGEDIDEIRKRLGRIERLVCAMQIFYMEIENEIRE